MTSVAENAPNKVAVWDLPTRLFKWSLVVTVVAAYVSAQLSSNTYTLHKYFGLTVMVLVVFRILWGFSAGRPAGFRLSLPPPARPYPICSTNSVPV